MGLPWNDGNALAELIDKNRVTPWNPVKVCPARLIRPGKISSSVHGAGIPLVPVSELRWLMLPNRR